MGLGAPTSPIQNVTLLVIFTFQGKTIALTGTPDLVEDTPNGALVTDYKFIEYAPRDQKILVCPDCQEEVSKDLVCPNCGQIGKSAVNRVNIPAKPHAGHDRQVNLYGLLIEKVLGKPVAGGQIIYLTKTPVRIPVSYERDATMAFVKQRLAALLDADLPPVLTEPDELWQCDYCPVRSQCEALHSAPVGKPCFILSPTFLLPKGGMQPCPTIIPKTGNPCFQTSSS